MPPALKQLQQLLTKGLSHCHAVVATAECLQAGASSGTYLGQSRAAHRDTGSERYLAFVSQMQKADMEPLGEAIEHFCHITDNFASGLFQCYDVEGLPPSNNDLEHCFGVARVHERRATGRRGAIPGVVVRGSVRVITAVVTKEQTFSAEELRPSDYQRWRDLRRTCSSVRKPAGNSSASAKILPPIWRLWKLSYSREVCHSAKKRVLISLS